LKKRSGCCTTHAVAQRAQGQHAERGAGGAVGVKIADHDNVQPFLELVPNRFEDGYGLSPEVVDQAHARGAQMIMTVDNGAQGQHAERGAGGAVGVKIADHDNVQPFLECVVQNVSYLVPNRFEDGYGLSPEVVDQAHARGAQMIMTAGPAR
jgi:single-stranded DNA-specific DHH superfamily exonuclease